MEFDIFPKGEYQPENGYNIKTQTIINQRLEEFSQAIENLTI